MAPKPQLPDILQSRGVLTAEQRAQAQRWAESNRAGFGDAVVRMGLASEESIAKAVAAQFGLVYAARENKLLAVEPGQGLERVIPEEYARQHCVVPLHLDEERGTLAVALSEPDDLINLENLKVLARHEIQPFVSTRSQILRAIDALYGGNGSLIDQAVKAAGGGSVSPADLEPRASKLDLDGELIHSKGAEAVSLVNAILRQAVQERASDIHLETFDDSPILRFRIDGTLYERTPPPMHAFLAVVSRVKILSRLDISEKRLPQDGAFSVKVQDRTIDLRVSTCPAAYGEKVVMRILDKEAVALDVDRIGFEPRQRDDFLAAARLPHGLIFLTGPTGSGKTTTLYAVLNTIRTPELNFMTIEDPIEIKLKGLTQVEVKPAIGLTFASALRSFLRQDPDVILVGEVRDQETAQICARAALTGHLVLSTLHTNDALSTVVRLLDLEVDPFLLADSLALAASQRLVRLLCPGCREAYRPDPAVLQRGLTEGQVQPPADLSRVAFCRPKGCEACAGTGFKGRVGIYEVVRFDEEMRQIVYHHRGDVGRLKEVAARKGIANLRASGWRKVFQGLTTVEEILSSTTAA